MANVHEDLILTGDHASLPAANDVIQGALYSCTTHKKIYQSTGPGNTWVDWHDNTALSAHASSHQNSGSDEISVAGLSGELADPQPTTLAKISDATAAGRALMDDADAAAQRTTLGLGTVATLASDTDTTLAADSDTRVATQKAVKAHVATAIAALVGTAPGVLDTLGEISDALADDASFASTMTTALAAKAPLASPALTGNPTAPTQATADDSTKIATTAFVHDVVAAIGGVAALDDLTDVDLTGEADGDVLQRVGGVWTPQTPSAGAGSAFGAEGPKTDPDNAGGGWAWENQGSATIVVSARDGSICLTGPADATNTYRARMKTAPSTPYTVIANLDFLMLNLDFHGFGICFGTGSDIKALYIVSVSGTVTLFILTTSGRAFGAAHHGPIGLPQVPRFLGIRDDGTNCKYYVGVEEENLTEIFSHARTTGLTPTQVGFFVAPRTASAPARLSLFSWKQQSAAPG